MAAAQLYGLIWQDLLSVLGRPSTTVNTVVDRVQILYCFGGFEATYNNIPFNLKDHVSFPINPILTVD